jgi:microcystin-dependent protein
MSEPFIGTIQPFGFQFAPYGWQYCAGQVVPISQYTTLFALTGTYYGGNGQSTFALPDLRGRMAIGQGQGTGLQSYDMGEQAGAETVTLLQSNMPPHNHSFTVSGGGAAGPIKASANPGTASAPTATVNTLASAVNDSGGAAILTYNAQAPDITLNIGGGGGTGGSGTIGINGGSTPFSLMQPYLVVNYCIAMIGVFPSRD